MLVAALAATLFGFALLVLALVTGILWLAFTCIGVCAVGVVFLVVDTLGIRGPSIRRPRRPASNASTDTATSTDTAASTGTATSIDAAPGDVMSSVDETPTLEIARVADPPPFLDADSSSLPDGIGRPSRHGRHERGDPDPDAGPPTNMDLPTNEDRRTHGDPPTHGVPPTNDDPPTDEKSPHASRHRRPD